jgi:release factor glutamine methyltransferase
MLIGCCFVSLSVCRSSHLISSRLLAMQFDPDLSHLTSNDYLSVYEPSEDSFLMLTALHQDSNYLNEKFNNRVPVALEIGSGSGICVNYLANLLNKQGLYYTVDVNPKACLATAQTFLNNKIHHYEVIRSDLLSCFKQKNHANSEQKNNSSSQVVPGIQFDVILFNPPYVPTENSAEMLGDDIEMSWAGGLNGTQTLFRFIDNYLAQSLSPDGLFYLVILKQNLPEEINSKIKSLGFKSTQIIRKTMGIEDLQIVRYEWNS